MKKSLLFIFSVLAGFILMFAYFKNDNNLKPSSKPIAFSLQEAPKDSIRGAISSLSGDVGWQSRIATIAATITVPRIIQQGEAIETKDDGKITVRFPDAYTIDIFPKSKLDFIQTLPSNFVISQEQGISEYTKTGATPLSIRSFHLLIQLNSGYIAITTDKDEKTVSVNVSSGSATLAYNDLQYISNVITIKAGKTFTFDDNTRTARITSNLQ